MQKCEDYGRGGGWEVLSTVVCCGVCGMPKRFTGAQRQRRAWFSSGGEVLRGLVLVNQVRGSVWAIDFPVYENTLVTFLAYPVLGAAVTVS
jgi:hypothetical protein